MNKYSLKELIELEYKLDWGVVIKNMTIPFSTKELILFKDSIVWSDYIRKFKLNNDQLKVVLDIILNSQPFLTLILCKHQDVEYELFKLFPRTIRDHISVILDFLENGIYEVEEVEELLYSIADIILDSYIIDMNRAILNNVKNENNALILEKLKMHIEI